MKNLLFDLDNTLYVEKHTPVLRHVESRIDEYIIQKIGVEQEVAERLRTEYYLTYGTTLTGLMLHHSVDPGEYLAYTHDTVHYLDLDPDRALLNLLKSIDLAKYVFTNAPLQHANRVLEALDIKDQFDDIFTIDNLGYHVKPQPESYQKVLTELKCEGTDCLLIDDHPANLNGAVPFGIRTVLVNHPPIEDCDHFLGSIYKLKKEVLDLI